MRRLALSFLVAMPVTGAIPSAMAQTPGMIQQAPLVSGQRVQVKKLARDMKNVRESIKTTGPSEMQSKVILDKYRKRFGQFKTAISRYPQLDDPDVIAAQSEYKLLGQALQAELERAQAQIKQLGNVQRRLALLEDNARKYPVPALPHIPFDAATAKQWVDAASNARTVAEHNSGQLDLIEPIAYLPNNPGVVQSGAPYDSNDVKRLRRISVGMFTGVQTQYKSLADELSRLMSHHRQQVQERWQEDPKSDKKWIFLGETSEAEAKQVFDEGRAVANSSLYLETALNRPGQEAKDTLTLIDKAEAQFVQNVQIALENSKLPSPKSKDQKQIKIARQILETPKYEFGKYGKIVLTTDKIVDRERKSSEIDIDDVEFKLGGTVEMSGTQTTWTYKWKEFRFAVPLQEENGNWHIWWITAKNFSSGGDRTPIGYWVSGKATKGNRILAKNIE